MLVEDDLGRIAAPRTGRIEILAPDNEPQYLACQIAPYTLFVSGGVKIGNMSLRSFTFHSGQHFAGGIRVDPDARRVLRLDGYLKQDVLFFEQRWINRKAVIKYAANVASGVHSGKTESPEDVLLQRMRNQFSVSRQGGVSIQVPQPSAPNDDFVYRPDFIDVVQYELLATVYFLVHSPTVERLEAAIRAELGLIT
jgi:hypothetical protein